MSGPRATVVLDSVSPNGDRLTTLEVVMHRFVLAEFNTHRVFSRNSASSRAIPVRKQLERVRNDPAIPLSWPAEQRGMQGGDQVAEPWRAEATWLEARDLAVCQVQDLADLGVHKSVVNRLLEPFMWHTVVVTATEWDGFWRQRCSPLAQPEMRAAAEAMRAAYDTSTPTPVNWGEWHLPYILDDERRAAPDTRLAEISAARCARVSSLTHDGVRDLDKDMELYHRLVIADPAHASPLEHPATPAGGGVYVPGNFVGWSQLRHRALGF